MTAAFETADPEVEHERRRQRSLRRAEQSAGPMEPELRFRVLLSILKMETDFLDLADKKARFALVIMSALNAMVLVLIMKAADAITAAGSWGLALRVLLACYFVGTIFYIWQAIEALRPRGQRSRPLGALPEEIVPEASMRVLFHADIARRERDDFRGLWSALRLDNVTTELSDQLHMVSRINVVKFAALGRLYQGVGVMTLLFTAALLTVLGGRL